MDSRTWDTLPGAELTVSRNMVWMESMITIWGFSLRITCSTVSRFVSHNKERLSPNLPIRSARMRICFNDSSPEI